MDNKFDDSSVPRLVPVSLSCFCFVSYFALLLAIWKHHSGFSKWFYFYWKWLTSGMNLTRRNKYSIVIKYICFLVSCPTLTRTYHVTSTLSGKYISFCTLSVQEFRKVEFSLSLCCINIFVFCLGRTIHPVQFFYDVFQTIQSLSLPATMWWSSF